MNSERGKISRKKLKEKKTHQQNKTTASPLKIANKKTKCEKGILVPMPNIGQCFFVYHN